MYAGQALRGGDMRVVVLGLANSTAMIAGAAALLILLGRHIRRTLPVGASLLRSVACAGVAYGAAFTAVTTSNGGNITGTASFALTGANTGTGASADTYTGFGSSSSATTVTGVTDWRSSVAV